MLVINCVCFFQVPPSSSQEGEVQVRVDDREELDFMFDEELDDLNVGRSNNFTEWFVKFGILWPFFYHMK